MTDVPAPINSDGRYYWYGDANGVTGGQIQVVGDPASLTGTAALTWSVPRHHLFDRRRCDGSQHARWQ